MSMKKECSRVIEKGMLRIKNIFSPISTTYYTNPPFHLPLFHLPLFIRYALRIILEPYKFQALYYLKSIQGYVHITQ